MGDDVLHRQNYLTVCRILTSITPRQLLVLPLTLLSDVHVAMSTMQTLVKSLILLYLTSNLADPPNRILRQLLLCALKPALLGQQPLLPHPEVAPNRPLMTSSITFGRRKENRLFVSIASESLPWFPSHQL